jgi:transposase
VLIRGIRLRAAGGRARAAGGLKIPRFCGHPNWRENAPGVIQDKRKKQRRKRRAFTPEFKAEAVRLCKVGDRTVTQVALDLDLTETALREWVKRADIDAGNGPPGALTSDERAELTQLRRENKRLQMEREILKKAAAFFAKEST